MSDTAEKLRHELQAAQRALDEAQARCDRHDAEYQAAAKELEDNHSTLRFMLEDLENTRRKVEQAHQEWMSALDVVNDPIFMHDKDFRILRCNKAYQQRAGIPFHEIIGQPYYEIFPKTGAPFPCCLRVMEKAEAAADEEEMVFGDATYRSRTFSVYGEQGEYLHSVHILEDITEKQRAEAERQRLSEAIHQAAEAIAMANADACITYINPAFTRLFGYTPDEIIGKSTAILSVPAAETVQPDAAFRIIREQGFFQGEALRRAKDGTPLPVYINVSALHGTEGKFEGFVTAITDLRPIRKAQQALAESEEKFRTLYESSRDAIMTATANEGFLGGNPAAIALFGCRNEQEFITLTPASASPEFQPDGRKSADKAQEMMRLAMEHGSHSFEWGHKRVDGSEFPADVLLTRTKIGGKSVIQATVRDITRRKRAEDALRKSKDLLQSIVENAPVRIFWKDRDSRYLGCNTRFAKDAGCSSPDDLTGKTDFDMGWKDQAELYCADDKAVMESGNPKLDYEELQTTPDGNTIWLHTSKVPLRDGSNQVFGILGIYEDITERKRAEQALHESEKLYRSLFENMLNGFAYCQMIFEQDQPQDFIYLSVNAAFETQTGLKNVAGRRVSEVIPGIRQADPRLFEIYGRVSLSGKPERFEIYVEALRQWFWISVYSPEKSYFVAVFDVITERKQAEAAIQHANRALATLSAVNRTLVHAASEEELLRAICQAITQQHGYRLAWVGYVQHDESKSIKIMAHAGHGEGYLEAMQITWAESEYGMGPSGRAARSGVTQLCQDMANDPLYLPWRAAARQYGFAASIALSLLNGDNTVFGILNVYAEEANAFTPNEIDLLEEMAGDLAFGVRSLHAQRERNLAMEQSQRHLLQLHKSLEDAIRAMASLVEMRDPYTAGHQVRVADLAMLVARQMGLPDDQVHAIYLAGVVHDLGKIQIPAEILSKPGRITDIEYSLIKIHPQAGYDILKGIDFPWPIAQVVLQHHERLDGSGYPQGLKGDAILLEARILSVADVVEAMSSHRPYRPGLGIEVALAEIGKQRGIYFDPQVVDACLVLFREQHYSFK